MAQVQFAAWNPADASGALSYADGNRSIAGNASTRFWIRSTLPSRRRAFFSVVPGNVPQGIGIAVAGDLGSFLGQNGLIVLWPAGFGAECGADRAGGPRLRQRRRDRCGA